MPARPFGRRKRHRSPDEIAAVSETRRVRFQATGPKRGYQPVSLPEYPYNRCNHEDQ